MTFLQDHNTNILVKDIPFLQDHNTNILVKDIPLLQDHNTNILVKDIPLLKFTQNIVYICRVHIEILYKL